MPARARPTRAAAWRSSSTTSPRAPTSRSRPRSTARSTFANNIRALANAGAKVIVDDVTYFNEPMFQDGPIAAAVNDVTAQGVTYFSSAANANAIQIGAPNAGANIGAYEGAQFRPAARTRARPACRATVTVHGLRSRRGRRHRVPGHDRRQPDDADPAQLGAAGRNGVTTNYDLFVLSAPNGTNLDRPERRQQPRHPAAVRVRRLSRAAAPRRTSRSRSARRPPAPPNPPAEVPDHRRPEHDPELPVRGADHRRPIASARRSSATTAPPTR